MLQESGSPDSSLNLCITPGTSILNWPNTTSAITAISAVLCSAIYGSEINLFFHLCLSDLINHDINMKAHPFLPKYSFLSSLNFKGIIFSQKSLCQNPTDSLNLSKASDLAFFCRKSLVRCLIYSCIFCTATSTL